jgi:hypothetical protein
MKTLRMVTAAGLLLLVSPARGGVYRDVTIGVPAAGGIDYQLFTAGAGTYTWTKPEGKEICFVVGFGSGVGGASGGYGTSDSGGGGGNHGPMAWGVFDIDDLNDTEDVVLGAGNVGGATKATIGNGNPSASTQTETSFGAAARNLLRILPQVASSTGGTGTSGTAGSTALANITTLVASGILPLNRGGAPTDGDDTAGAASVAITATIESATSYQCQMVGPIYACSASSGAGGGGTNGGANFTAGGNGGRISSPITAAPITPAAAGGATNGANGADGLDGGKYSTGSTGHVAFMGGQGGAGGAGGADTTQDGGRGGDGGNCGGGAGGGGSSEAGAVGSGRGGNGGDGCIAVACM